MNIVTTDRLNIRQFKYDDAELLYKYSQEEIARKELPDEVLNSVNAAIEKISFFHDQYLGKNILVYAVELKNEKFLIGHVSLSPISEGMEIGYSIATAYQSNGYASELVLPFTNWAKQSFQLDKVYGIVKVSNLASIKSLEKSGYIQIHEGVRDFWGEQFLMRTYVI